MKMFLMIIVAVFTAGILGAVVAEPPPGDAVKSGLFCDAKGNVGIGTRSPRARLEVKGALLVEGDLNITGRVNYRQRDCRKVKYNRDGSALCEEGYYAAGVWKADKGEVGGAICCR